MVPYKNAQAQIYSKRTEETLSQPAKDFRDAFIREYLKDFRADHALARVGFVGATNTLKSRGTKLLKEPYVQSRLDLALRTVSPTDVVTRGQVMGALWKEANDPENSGSERIAALGHVGKMLGMGREEDKDDTPSGVMLVPVFDDWAAQAANSQALLKGRIGDAPLIVEAAYTEAAA